MQRMCWMMKWADRTANKEVLEMLRKLEEQKPSTNPLWKGLKKFKDLRRQLIIF